MLLLLSSNTLKQFQPIICQYLRRGYISIDFVESKQEISEFSARYNLVSLLYQLPKANHNQSQSYIKLNTAKLTHVYIYLFDQQDQSQFSNLNLQLSISYNILHIAMKAHKNRENRSQEQNTRETFIYKGVTKVASQPKSWKDFSLKPEIVQAIKEMGYETPSEVQKSVLPAVLQEKDVIYQARSGMGKTSVFVIGVLNSITPQANGQYLPQQCIVIAHTRELAYQIWQQFKKHAKYLTQPKLRFACVFGGQSIQKDMQMLCDKKKIPHILIGTIGRLLDLMQRGYINLKPCKYLVVDQCDQMLRNSQELQMIVGKLNKKTQKIMLSSTIDDKIVSFCKQIMGSSNIQTIKMDQGKLSLVGLQQFYTILPEKNKFTLLQNLLDRVAFDQAIIFVNRIQRVGMLADLLDQLLFNPIRIHSGLTQKERLACYDKFKANESRVLVATDLFGRGIDILRVNLVINYDFPFDDKTYIHRVGRAGRYNRKGIIVNFVKDQPQGNGKSDIQTLDHFCHILQQRIVKLPNNFDGTGFI